MFSALPGAAGGEVGAVGDTGEGGRWGWEALEAAIPWEFREGSPVPHTGSRAHSLEDVPGRFGHALGHVGLPS